MEKGRSGLVGPDESSLIALNCNRDECPKRATSCGGQEETFHRIYPAGQRDKISFAASQGFWLFIARLGSWGFGFSFSSAQRTFPRIFPVAEHFYGENNLIGLRQAGNSFQNPLTLSPKIQGIRALITFEFRMSHQTDWFGFRRWQ